MLEAAIAIAAIAVGAGLAMGIGAVGPAVGEGYAAGKLWKPLPVSQKRRTQSAQPWYWGRLSLSPLVSTHWLLPYC